MLSTFVTILHVFVCLVLVFVVLLQQGRGGGIGSAFGGASAQVFGGSGAGNILTRATSICAGIFMVTSVTLAYMSSSGDRELRARIAAEQAKAKANDRGTKRDAVNPASSETPAPAANANVNTSPNTAPAPAPATPPTPPSEPATTPSAPAP